MRKNDFEQHWRDEAGDELPQSKLAAAADFLGPLFQFMEQAPAGARVLDAGCGDGVHVAAVEKRASLADTHRFMGIDISEVALERARSHDASQRWSFRRADVCRLSFDDDSFDAVFSFGVLAYTGQPAKAFAELCRVTRPGGLVGIWVAPKPGGGSGVLLRFVRWMCGLLPPFGKRWVANLIVPFLAIVPTRSGLTLRNASWRQCREVVLVNIAPPSLVFPAAEDIETWFRDNGVMITHRDDEHPVTLWGVVSP